MFSKVDLSGQRLAIAVHEGDIGVAVTAVPDEPETYAMLLAGLGLVGLARRRRNCTR
jgi:MYXO-CTERM domain-containing protein